MNFLLILASLFVLNLFSLQEAPRFEHKVYFEKTDSELHVFKIKGRLPGGKTIMILGGIQGDENGGYISADLYADIRLKKGNIIVVPRANFLSILTNKRKINEDMNRRFSENIGDMYEDKVVSVLKDLMQESDLFLNLHEGSGFYTPKYEDDMHNPMRFGQSIIADTEVYHSERCNCDLRLKEMAQRIVENVNKEIDNPKYYFSFNNHNTSSNKTLHPEQRKSATYYALYKVGIPAFGIETSKSIKDLELKVRMHSSVINAFIKEVGVEFENPAIEILKPEFRYLLVSINGEIKVITRADQIRIPRNASFEIKHIESNYVRGLTADVLGYGGLHDYGQVFKIESDTKVIIKKDSSELAVFPITVYDELKGNAGFYPPQLVSSPQLVSFVVKVGEEEKFIVPGEELKVVAGDTVTITDAIFYPPVKRRDKMVNFVGFAGGNEFSSEDDLGLKVAVSTELIPKYAIEKDKYPVYVKYKNAKVGQFFVKVVHPSIKYFILKDSDGKRLCYISGEMVNLKKLGRVTMYDIVSDYSDTTNMEVESPCGIHKISDVIGKDLSDVTCSKNLTDKKSSVMIKVQRGGLVLGELGLALD